jgi:D-alanyl-lipoteichoic acid acyltransferase DltB (MBOAT superfamily)
MTITSLYFFIFLILTTIVYYICPKKYRWISLLVFSAAFFLLSSWKVSFYFAIGTIIAYVGARLIQEKCQTDKLKRIVLIISISCELLILFLLKYINIIPNTINGFGNLFNIDLNFATINLIAPLGISYYTLSLWGYMVDVYRTTTEAEKNYFKLALFACYYPCLISGPFIRYPEIKKEFFEARSLDWDNIFMGFHRIVYGLLKKMFIADNLAVFVNVIFADTGKYSGPFIIVGVMMYAVQIYCDFSGCMDIIIGASKLYGVKLPENFDSPFFSKNLSEFWRRWHITLGLWGKDYIMYPLLISAKFQQLGKKAKKIFGKKTGKKIPVILSILVLWAFIGIWHGASYKYIFAAGILPWIYFSLSELFSDLFKKANTHFHFRTDTLSFHLFQSARTILLMLIIWLFALSPSLMQSGKIFGNLFAIPSLQTIQDFAIENILGDLGIRQIIAKYVLLVISILGVTLVDYLKYKEIDVGDGFNKQAVWFRYLILFAMIITTICFGVYGPGYNPADFIYGGF